MSQPSTLELILSICATRDSIRYSLSGFIEVSSHHIPEVGAAKSIKLVADEFDIEYHARVRNVSDYGHRSLVAAEFIAERWAVARRQQCKSVVGYNTPL